MSEITKHLGFFDELETFKSEFKKTVIAAELHVSALSFGALGIPDLNLEIGVLSLEKKYFLQKKKDYQTFLKLTQKAFKNLDALESGFKSDLIFYLKSEIEEITKKIDRSDSKTGSSPPNITSISVLLHILNRSQETICQRMIASYLSSNEMKLLITEAKAEAKKIREKHQKFGKTAPIINYPSFNNLGEQNFISRAKETCWRLYFGAIEKRRITSFSEQQKDLKQDIEKDLKAASLKSVFETIKLFERHTPSIFQKL